MFSNTTSTEGGRSAVSSQVTGVVPEGDSSGEFGANEWLVDEMYERYLADKNSVDQSWWPILENYQSTLDPTPTGAIDIVQTSQASPDAVADLGVSARRGLAAER